MLKIVQRNLPKYSTNVRKFVKYLNSHDPVDEVIEVYFFDLPSIQDIEPTNEWYDRAHEENAQDETNEWLALYLPKYKTILMAGNAFDSTFYLQVLAHEYHHALKHTSDVKMREDSANSFAFYSMLNYQMRYLS